MSDSTRIKATIICPLIGIIATALFQLVAGGFYNAFDILFAILIGFIFGLGIVSVPFWSGKIWGLLEIVRDFGPVGFVICLILWYFAFGLTVIITPIITIVKFVKAIKNVREDREVNKIVEQAVIESKDEDWRDHF